MGSPFAADIVDGFVVGRGTQDMKSVCIQHLVRGKKAKKISFFFLKKKKKSLV